MGIGQAAGTAAAMSLEEDAPPSRLDGAAVRRRLASLGVLFD